MHVYLQTTYHCIRVFTNIMSLCTSVYKRIIIEDVCLRGYYHYIRLFISCISPNTGTYKKLGQLTRTFTNVYIFVRLFISNPITKYAYLCFFIQYNTQKNQGNH